MNNKEILDNAPEGTTHIGCYGIYLKAAKSGFMEIDSDGSDWDYDYAGHSDVRSLEDIRKIVAMEEGRVFILDDLANLVDKHARLSLRVIKLENTK